MAMPATLDPNTKLYQIKFSGSSAFQIDRSRRIDEYTREQRYKRHEDERKKISAIRQRCNTIREWGSMPFFGAYITNEIGLNQMIEACRKADQEMKAIDPDLFLTLKCIEIPITSLTAQKSVVETLLNDIRREVTDQMLKEVEARIDKVQTPRGRKALNTMIDNMKNLNLTGDPAIDAELEQMRDRINKDQLKELRDELRVVMEETRNRGEALELVDDIRVTKEPAPGTPGPAIPLAPSNGRDLEL